VGELVVAKNATVIWRIEQPGIDPGLHDRLLAEGFEPKREHHITLIGTMAAARVPDLDALRAAVARRQPSLRAADLRLDDELYRIERPKVIDGVVHPRETLIALARSAWIGVFIDGVNNELGAEIPKPFAHATLYTRGSAIARRGIGIETPQEFVEYSSDLHTRDWQDITDAAA
jgi:hypothetical protein